VKKSFTLIELLVVVAIIGILAAVGTPIFQGFMTTAKINAAKENHVRAKDMISAYVANYKQLQTGVREKEKVETKGESVTKSRR